MDYFNYVLLIGNTWIVIKLPKSDVNKIRSCKVTELQTVQTLQTLPT